MSLCPVCGPEDAPRPSGVASYTYGGITHKARECAAISAVGQLPIRGDEGYWTKSGLKVCSDDCFDHGQPHTVDSDNRHWNPQAHEWQPRDAEGNFVSG